MTASHDFHGRPRVSDLARFLAAVVTDYCSSRKKIARALGQTAKQGWSTASLNELTSEARNLFTASQTTGEGGEILLFVLLEEVLGAPQIISKMALKTSPDVHYHGADGIHADLRGTTLTLFWGESKLWKSFGKALKECVDSVTPFITQAGGSRARKERDIQLINDHISEINSSELEELLLRYLDKNDPLYNQVEQRAACLVGFDHGSRLGTTKAIADAEMSSWIRANIASWETSIHSRVTDASLQPFKFHFFIVPFPGVADFRLELLRELGSLQVQSAGSKRVAVTPTKKSRPKAKTNKTPRMKGRA